jgi:hypothetical protein
VKIRSICVGIDAAWPLDTAAIQRAGAPKMRSVKALRTAIWSSSAE